MPSHTGVRTLVVGDAELAVPAGYRTGARIVRTALDLIRALDEAPERVVLLGKFASDRSFAAFIAEASPGSEIVAIADEPEELCCA